MDCEPEKTVIEANLGKMEAERKSLVKDAITFFMDDCDPYCTIGHLYCTGMK